MSALITVTGITGFVGMRIAAQALNDGYRVRATLRNPKQEGTVRAWISHAAPVDNLEFVQTDLLADDGWDEAMTGTDYVIHAASPLILGDVPDESVLFGPAVDGTDRVLRAAKKAGVKRVIVTSTALTIAGHITEGLATPTDFTPADDPRANLYTKSKIAAEQVVRNFAAENPSGPEVVTIHPGVIIGPPLNPEEDSESIALFRDIWSGSRPAIPGLAFPMADVRDVAQVHLAAMTSPTMSTARYMVAFSTEPQQFPDIARVLRNHGNEKAPRLTIPMFALRILARFNSEIRSLVDSTDGLSMKLDISATKRDLNWSPMSFEQSVLDTARALEQKQSTGNGR
jgi:dihydroflavonol-4-reductase